VLSALTARVSKINYRPKEYQQLSNDEKLKSDYLRNKLHLKANTEGAMNRAVCLATAFLLLLTQCMSNSARYQTIRMSSAQIETISSVKLHHAIIHWRRFLPSLEQLLLLMRELMLRMLPEHSEL
jgi:hypothetical protein